MAEKAALLFWRVWAVAALVGTALPAARLVRREQPTRTLERAHAGRAAQSEITPTAGVAIAPKVDEDRLLAKLAKAETGPERCSLCDELPVSEDPRFTYALTSILEHTHLSSVRACAARALSRQPTAEARSWVSELVDDPQAEVREAALEALAEAKDDSARTLLLEATHSENREVRLGAVTALLQAQRPGGFEAAAAVLPTIEDRDALLALVDAVAQAHDPRSVPVFLALFESGERESHLRAIAALGKLGSALAVPVLEPLLGTGSTEEFDAAARALVELDPAHALPKLREQLESGDEVHQRLALGALLDTKSPDAASIAHQQLQAKDPVRVRRVLQYLMRAPDPSFEQELTQLATSATPSLQRIALRVLRRLDTPSAQASADRIEGKEETAPGSAPHRSLQELVSDPSEAAQAELLRSLDPARDLSSELAQVIAFAPASTIERVIARGGLDLASRRAMMEGLAQRGEPRFAPAMRAALAESDAQLRAAALRGLVGLGDSGVAAEVARLTRAEDAGDRTLAIELLSARSDEAATREITALTADSNMEVVCGALNALETRSPELVLQLATRAFGSASSDDRLTLLGNLNGLPQSVLRPLNELALVEGDDNAAIAASQALTSLEGPESAQRLLAVASDANRSQEVRAAAARGLRSLGGPLARSNHALLDTLSSPDDPGEYTCNATQ